MSAATRRDPQRRSARKTLARTAFAYLALLALVLQSLVVQTHVHVPHGDIVAAIDIIAGEIDAAGSAAKTVLTEASEQDTKAPAGKYPLKDDTAHCSLCQQTHHNGQYLSPQAASVSLPLLLHVQIIPLSEIAHIVSAVSHAWKSRAPPSA